MSDEVRYGVTKAVHVGVKLLHDHSGIASQDVIKGLPTPIGNDNG